MKKEVKYLGVVIGYSDGKTIEFLDNKEAQMIIEKLTKSYPIGISSRGVGTVDENGYVIHEDDDNKIIEFAIIDSDVVGHNLNTMEEKIEKKLAELYKQQANLTDEDRVWIKPTNCGYGSSRGDLIKINYVLIRELEDLLKQ